MKRYYFILSMALIALCLTGCAMISYSPGQNSSLTGIGEPEVYTFQVGEFKEVYLEIFCVTYYYAAPSDVITLEIQPNLLEYISVEESGDLLSIRSIKNINWSNYAPILTISTPFLSSLTIDGAGDFIARAPIKGESFTFKVKGAGSGRAELDVENLTVLLSGFGSLELFGRADKANFTMDGLGNIEALSLQTRESSINSSSACNITISCSEKLTVNAEGIGSVEYRGSPILNLNNDGLISVEKVD